MKTEKEKGMQAQEPASAWEGFFELSKSPNEEPSLIGSKCGSCGEVFFPARMCCRRCTGEDMVAMNLSGRMKLYSFSSIKVRPPHFIGDIPYLVGVVESPEGERINTLLTDCDLDSLHIGMEMELVIDKVGTTKKPFGRIDVGAELLGWKFRPVRSMES